MASSVALVDTHRIAQILGIRPDSVRQAHYRAARRRRAGEVGPADMPEPARYLAGRPVWDLPDIEDWMERKSHIRGGRWHP